MTAEQQLTAHFGIAPLRMIPSGLQTLTMSVAAALKAQDLPAKPYWHTWDDWVTIITQDDAGEVAKALREQLPHGSRYE